MRFGCQWARERKRRRGRLDRYYTGLACIVFAAISWAVYGLAQKQLLGRWRSPQILLCLYVGGAILFAPLAEPLRFQRLTATELGAFVFASPTCWSRMARSPRRSSTSKRRA